jgi:hypothetical protein
MVIKRWTLRRAREFVVRSRPQVAPNLGFLQQLLDLEKLIFAERARPAVDTDTIASQPAKFERNRALSDSWAAEELVVIPSYSLDELRKISAFHPGERLVKGADDAKWKDIANTAAMKTAAKVAIAGSRTPLKRELSTPSLSGTPSLKPAPSPRKKSTGSPSLRPLSFDNAPSV